MKNCTNATDLLKVSFSHMSGRILILIIGLFGYCLPLSADVSSKPNIIMIVADDLGLQLGAYGETRIQTPTLDSLAREGVAFKRAFVTQSSCSPSRASILTGLYPSQNGQIGLSHVGYRLRPDLYSKTLPSILKANGYRVGLLGKIHVKPIEAYPADYPPPGDRSDEKASNHIPFDWWRSIGRRLGLLDDKYSRGMHDYDWIANEVGEFIENSATQPFFMWVGLQDPHRWLVGGGFPDQVLGSPIKLVNPQKITPFEFLGVDSSELRHDVASYLNSVKRMDEGVGKILNAVRELSHSQDRNTIVIFLSDHGPPYDRAKTTNYEAGLRIPLIFSSTNIDLIPGFRNELVSTVDIFPTILELAGIDSSTDLPGHSLVPLLQNNKPVEWRTHIYAEFNAHGALFVPGRSIRGDQFKLIMNLIPNTPSREPPSSPKTARGDQLPSVAAMSQGSGSPEIRKVYERFYSPPKFELYDLTADPNEFINLAYDPSFQDEVTILSRRLEKFRMTIRDPLLEPDILNGLPQAYPWW